MLNIKKAAVLILLLYTYTLSAERIELLYSLQGIYEWHNKDSWNPQRVPEEDDEVIINVFIIELRFSKPDKIKIKKLEIGNEGHVVFKKDITITHSFSNTGNGTFEHNSGEFIIEPPIGGEAEIKANSDKEKTVFNVLKCEVSKASTLKINGKITCGTLQLNGKENELLTIKGEKAPSEAGEIYFKTPNSQRGSSYLKIASGVKVTENFPITNSTRDFCEKFYGNYEGWDFKGIPAELYWIGKTKDWNTGSNWAYDCGKIKGSKGYIIWDKLPDKDTDVKIINLTGIRVFTSQGLENLTLSNKYPELSQDVEAKSVVISEAPVYLDLSEYSIKSGSGTISETAVENKGILKLIGPTNQMEWLSSKLTQKSGCTVVYHNNTGSAGYKHINLMNLTAYENLIIESEKTIDTTGGSVIKVKSTFTAKGTPITFNCPLETKKFEVLSSSSITAEAITAEDGTEIKTACTIESAEQHYKSKVEIKGDTVFQMPSAQPETGKITFSGKVNAEGKKLTLKGGTISSKEEITAASLEVSGKAWTAEKNITLTGNFHSSVEKLETKAGINSAEIKVSGEEFKSLNITARDVIDVSSKKWESGGEITAKNITVKAPSAQWISSGNIQAAENITAHENAQWKASSGIISVKGKLEAERLVHTGGKLILSGGGAQTLKADKLFELITENTGSADITAEFNEAETIEVKSGKLVLAKDIVLTKAFNNSGGVFDAAANKKTVTLKPAGTLSITGKTVSSANDAETADTGTRFYKLHCKNAGGKTLSLAGDIEVLHSELDTSGNDSEALKLEGSDSDNLKIAGTARIWFNKTPPHPRAKKGGIYLSVSSNVEIRGGCYRVLRSVRPEPSPRNWIFEEYTKIRYSTAVTNGNDICIVFSEKISRPYPNTLRVSIPGQGERVSSGIRPYRDNSETGKHAEWIFKFDSPFTPEDILKDGVEFKMGKNSLDPTFIAEGSDERPAKKGKVSDVGINLVEPLFAANTKTIRSWDGSEKLPFLNTKIAVAVPFDDKPLQMYLDSEPSDEYWIKDKPDFWQNGFTLPENSDAALFNAEPNSAAGQKIFTLPTTHPKMSAEASFEYILYYAGIPCARLKDKSDMLSFDVWRFGMLKAVLQRGGASVFNNVINPLKGQLASIEIQTKKDGMLTVQIMTLDGNILKTLERSQKTAGNYSYYWDGKNNAGSIVARGLYFVRISGAGIDEIRKIMVIKE